MNEYNMQRFGLICVMCHMCQQHHVPKLSAALLTTFYRVNDLSYDASFGYRQGEWHSNEIEISQCLLLNQINVLFGYDVGCPLYCYLHRK